MKQPHEKLTVLNLPKEVLDTCRKLAADCGHKIDKGPYEGIGNLVSLLRAIAQAYSENPERTAKMLAALFDK